VINTAFDIQILDLANNDLGSDSPMHLKSVLGTLISLNLSNTKLGQRGALNLAKYIKESDNEQGHHSL